MASSGVEAEMELHSQIDVGKSKMASSCVTPQLMTEDCNSHDQKLTERESPNSPSPVKKWEMGSLLQSFKSKMASFTEIVMSPVRLFKPTDSLSSIVLPDQREQFIGSNVESSTWTEEGDATDGKCKSGLLLKRPSAKTGQCDPPPKRHRVIQKLDFETVSTSNHEPVLKQNELNEEAQVAPKEEDTQINRLLSQSQAILQDCKCDHRPHTSQSSYLKSGLIPSSDLPAKHMSCQANLNTKATVVLQRLSSTCSSDTVAYGNNCESNAVFKDGAEQTFLNQLDSYSTSSNYLLKDENTHRGGSDESCVQATRKSPRKLYKYQSESVLSTSTKLATLAVERKPLDGEMKDVHSISVTEWTNCSVEVSDPPKSTSVADVNLEICSEAPTTETKKDMLSKRKHDFYKAEERNLRQAKNKRVGITLEENQEDIICVQRKKRNKAQKCQSSNMGAITSNSADVYASESCDSTESKEMRQEKTVKNHLRKRFKCRTLLTSINKGDATDTKSSQNASRKVLIDKSLHTINDCNYENSRLSDPQGLQDSAQTREAEMKNTRKTRRVFRSAGEASLQKRNLRPPKHKFDIYSETSVVDPAGPSAPSKRTLLQSVRSDSSAPQQSEREQKPNRSTKVANRQNRKQHVSLAKRKNVIKAKDKAEMPEKMIEDIPVVSLSGSGSNRLLRSYSCPEILSLVFSDYHVTPSHSTSPTKISSAVPLPTHLHSPSKRTRRHTVCSEEIEREIAPLCLRKEVYPAIRGGLSHPSCPSSPYSLSNSLTALATCFLSSPLAFLSKSSSQGRGHASDSAHSNVSSFTSSFVTSSSSSSLCSSPLAYTLTSSNPLTGPSTVVTPSPEIASASVPSLCRSLEGDHGCQKVVDEEERSSFSLQLSTAVSEEKALSDSEIKTDHKEGQRGKVSSIRICKKIPKAQNNLTPMGLPKVVRIKKKDFSLEEIYTNKNFSKPPDGRLETIFEVPLNRRDGSQAFVGQKKVKRFVEFPELGVARKPKKPLIGGVAGGGTQRKAGGNSGICRTRRGVGASSKVEDGLTLQELDSLLCSKLEELDTWMALQQVAC